jgi:preprotein translocase subunit SecB
MADATPVPAAVDQADGPQFSIEKLYVKDASLEIPNAPQIFLEREAPKVDIQLHHESKQVEPDIYETVLTVTVTASVNEKTMFLAEVGQAGIFVCKNIPQQDLAGILAIATPNILYPYVREVVSDLISRGGFPPVILNPVNFEALAQQQAQFQAEQAAQGAKPTVQ